MKEAGRKESRGREGGEGGKEERWERGKDTSDGVCAFHCDCQEVFSWDEVKEEEMEEGGRKGEREGERGEAEGGLKESKREGVEKLMLVSISTAFLFIYYHKAFVSNLKTWL